MDCPVLVWLLYPHEPQRHDAATIAPVVPIAHVLDPKGRPGPAAPPPSLGPQPQVQSAPDPARCQIGDRRWETRRLGELRRPLTRHAKDATHLCHTGKLILAPLEVNY